MQTPLQITFRGMAPSEALEALIRKRAERLERFNERITRCHVVVDMPHRHHRKGNAYRIHLDISTPTAEIVTTTHDSENPAHVDIHAVLRDAFDAATRQLEEDLRRKRVG